MALHVNNVEIEKVIFNVDTDLDEVWYNTTLVFVSTIFVPKPTATSTSFTYNGVLQNLSVANYNADAMIASGDVAGINAGDYTVTYTLKKGFAWEDGSIDSVTIPWVINKMPVTAPWLNATSFPTVGDWVGPTTLGTSAYTVTGGTLYLNYVGGAYITFALADTANTCWADNYPAAVTPGTTAPYSLYLSTYAGTGTFRGVYYLDDSSGGYLGYYNFTYGDSWPNHNSFQTAMVAHTVTCWSPNLSYVPYKYLRMFAGLNANYYVSLYYYSNATTASPAGSGTVYLNGVAVSRDAAMINGALYEH